MHFAAFGSGSVWGEEVARASLRDWNHDIPPSHHITFLPWFRDSLAGCSGQEAAPLHSHLSAEEMGSITDYIVQCREIYYIGKKPAAAVVYLGHEQPGGRAQAVIIPPFSTEFVPCLNPSVELMQRAVWSLDRSSH